jgi:Ca2+-binding RTX toxin-like protein
VTIIGTDQDDEIYGGESDHTIFGLDGDDLIYGGKGNDDIFGGYGNDEIYTGPYAYDSSGTFYYDGVGAGTTTRTASRETM